jgi:translation initiation factor IF-3
MDFGKFIYRKEKEARKQKAKIKKSETKGIRLTIKIGQHDFETKVNQAANFLDKGHKVKITLVMKGREKAHFDLAREIIQKFITAVPQETTIQEPMKKEGGKLITVITKK